MRSTSGVRFPAGASHFSSKRPDRLCGTTSPFFSEYQGRRCVNLTTPQSGAEVKSDLTYNSALPAYLHNSSNVPNFSSLSFRILSFTILFHLYLRWSLEFTAYRLKPPPPPAPNRSKNNRSARIPAGSLNVVSFRFVLVDRKIP
jgi:hypothetical protein